ncbi:MAG TPA: response regulator [Polyangiaceae bacterium]|jgi:two-component system response regulator RegA|nr:response regulator [Polyangiaceae bacterium]
MNFSQFQGQSILVVDDDEFLRQQLVRAFERRGLEVRSAGGIQDAQRLIEEESPELAVVDLKMPDGSGLKLVQVLQSADPTTKIVVLTGYGSIATAIDAVRMGATYYLQKPADADEVLAAFLRGEGQQQDPESVPRAPTLARAEWEHINRVLNDCSGNLSEAARRLGLHRRSLQRKLHKFPPRQ